MPSMSPTTPVSTALRSRASNVRALVATLAGRRQKTTTDRQIARRAFVLFERMGVVHTQGLHFYVFDGAVSVYGAVATPEVRDQVVAALGSIPGVRQLTEHVQVANPHKPRKAFSIRPVLFDSL